MPNKRKTSSKKAARKLKLKVIAAAKVAQLQAQGELVLGDTDVICGRGAGVTSWWGNLTFRYVFHRCIDRPTK